MVGPAGLGRARMSQGVTLTAVCRILTSSASRARLLAGPVRPQRQQDLGLEPVGFLVLVDENVIKAPADFGGDGRLGHRVTPVQEEIVVIENVVLLLSCDIGLKEATELARRLVTPRKNPDKRLFERTAGIDGVRVEGNRPFAFVRNRHRRAFAWPPGESSSRVWGAWYARLRYTALVAR